MAAPRLVIIGGGLAGLSAGCYARANGFETTIVEHHDELGGVCGVHRRDAYLVDGCLPWVTTGPFLRIYEELGILPRVVLRGLEHLATYRHAGDAWEVPIVRDFSIVRDALRAVAPEDAAEVARLLEDASELAEAGHRLETTHEATAGLRLRRLWSLRHELPTLIRYRGPVGEWSARHLRSPRVRRLIGRLVPDEAPTVMLLMTLGYLSRGWLARPEGGPAVFRDSLAARVAALGGTVHLRATVDEVLVRDGRAAGVRLEDGTILDADVVISTSSAPETVFRLLASRFGAPDWRRRLARWPLAPPMVLASFGVARQYPLLPDTLIVDGIRPVSVGGVENEHLVLRVSRDDPAAAPPGHTLVQARLGSDYDWWATRYDRYADFTASAAARIAGRIDGLLPGFAKAIRMTDIATPLTYWRTARSWRGACDGWLPTPATLFARVPKVLPGLDRFYMAGRWVEPGGGGPMVLLSGRQAIAAACADMGRPFTTAPSDRVEELQHVRHPGVLRDVGRADAAHRGAARGIAARPRP